MNIKRLAAIIMAFAAGYRIVSRRSADYSKAVQDTLAYENARYLRMLGRLDARTVADIEEVNDWPYPLNAGTDSPRDP